MSDNVSNPIKDWLSGNRSYKAGLALFSQYGITKYPKIWTEVSKGNFGSNRSYLEHYLTKLSKEITFSLHQSNPTHTIKTKPVIVSMPAEKPEETIKEKPNIEIELHKKITSQKNKRLVIAQSFQDCETNEDRANVCDQLEGINALILEKQEALQYFLKFETLPKGKEEEIFELAKTDAELRIQQNQAQANKGGIKKKIEHALLFPEGSPKRAKLQEWESKHSNLLIRIQLIKDERKRIESTSKR